MEDTKSAVEENCVAGTSSPTPVPEATSRIQKDISTDDKFFVKVLDETLDTQAIMEMVADDGAGAISSFVGVTRDNFNGKRVLRLEYEGYVPMAEREMLKICMEAAGKWDVKKIAMYHRLGVCGVGQASVVIAVSSPHRLDSIEATHFAIDTLKARVPIWKLEVYEGDEDRVWKENAEWEGGRRVMTALPPVPPSE